MSPEERSTEYAEGLRSLHEISNALREFSKKRPLPGNLPRRLELLAATTTGLEMRFQRHAPTRGEALHSPSYTEGLETLRHVSTSLREIARMPGLARGLSEVVQILTNTMSQLELRFERHAPAPKLRFPETMSAEKKP